MPFADFFRSLMKRKKANLSTEVSTQNTQQSESNISYIANSSNFNKNTTNYGRTLIMQDDNFLILNPEYLENKVKEKTRDVIKKISDQRLLSYERKYKNKIKSRRVCAICKTDSALRVALKNKCRKRLLGDYECDCQHCKTLFAVRKSYDTKKHCKRKPSSFVSLPKKELVVYKRLENKVNYIWKKVHGIECMEKKKVCETETQYSNQMLIENKTIANRFKITPSCHHKTWHYKINKVNLTSNSSKCTFQNNKEEDYKKILEESEKCVENSIKPYSQRPSSIPRRKISKPKLNKTSIEQNFITRKEPLVSVYNEISNVEDYFEQDDKCDDFVNSLLDNTSDKENEINKNVTKVFICKNSKPIKIVDTGNENTDDSVERNSCATSISNASYPSFVELLSCSESKVSDKGGNIGKEICINSPCSKKELYPNKIMDKRDLININNEKNSENPAITSLNPPESNSVNEIFRKISDENPINKYVDKTDETYVHRDFLFDIPIHLNLSYENSINCSQKIPVKTNNQNDSKSKIDSCKLIFSNKHPDKPSKLLSIDSIRSNNLLDLTKISDTSIKNEKFELKNQTMDNENDSTQHKISITKKDLFLPTINRQHDNKKVKPKKCKKHKITEKVHIAKKPLRSLQFQNKQNIDTNLSKDVDVKSDIQPSSGVDKNVPKTIPENENLCEDMNEKKTDFLSTDICKIVECKDKPEKQDKSKIPIRIIKKPSNQMELKSSILKPIFDGKLVKASALNIISKDEKEKLLQKQSENEIELDTNVEEFVSLLQKLNKDKGCEKNKQIIDSIKKLEECNQTLEWLAKKLEN